MNKKGKLSRKTNPPPQLIAKEEMNLAEFPFTLLSHRASEGQKTIEIFQQIRGRNGRSVGQRWLVTGSDKHGLPLAVDNDVYLALMQVFKEDGFRSRKVHFTRYRLLKIMGKTPSKEKYDMIESALDRLISVLIKSENAFWDNKAKAYVTRAFHLFESYDLYDERSQSQDAEQSILPLSNVVMSEFLFNSIKSGYIKNLDIGFYFTLQTPLAKRLYRFLDKKRYHRSTYEADLTRLSSLLPLQDRYPSQIKRRLKKAHKELVEKGYLKDITYKRDPNSDREIVVYVFGQPLPEPPELEFGSENRAPDQENEDSLLQDLVNRGVTEPAAQKLVANHPPEQIKRQIAVFDWLTSRKSPLVGKNPAGFLRKSIEENYQPPEEYCSHLEREARRIEEERIMAQRQVEEEEREKELTIIKAYKESLSQEERAKLREMAIAEIENSGQYKEEFITEGLIEAKENEIVKAQMGIGG